MCRRQERRRPLGRLLRSLGPHTPALDELRGGGQRGDPSRGLSWVVSVDSPHDEERGAHSGNVALFCGNGVRTPSTLPAHML